MWMASLKQDFVDALQRHPQFDVFDNLDFRRAYIRNGDVFLDDFNLSELDLFFWFGELDRRNDSFHIDVLEALGHKVVVVNNARALRIALDKLVTQLHLSRHGIPVPEFLAISRNNIEQARAILDRKPFILKPRLGTFGIGITRIESYGQLVDIIDYSEMEAHFIEELIECTPDDFIGINVIGGKIISSYGKEPSKFHDWKIFDRERRGGGMVSREPTPEQAHIAVEVFRATNLDLLGIDIIRSKTGQSYVVDVNSFPGLYPTSSNHSAKLAKLFVELIEGKLKVSWPLGEIAL